MAPPQDFRKVHDLLAGLDDEQVREVSLRALRSWRSRAPNANRFSMHGDYGREMVLQLAKLKGVQLEGNADTGEVNSLKEAFAGGPALADNAMSGVLEFIWWFMRAGFGVEFRDQGGYPLAIRLTRAGANFLDSKTDWGVGGEEADSGPGGIARRALWDAGWFVPLDPPRLGGGGGGDVFTCYSRALVEAVEGHNDPSTRSRRFQAETRLIDQLVRAKPEGSYAALKIAHRADPRLAREVAAMQKVTDPHLVRVLARDESDSPRWFLMEFLDGGTLHKRLDQFHGQPRRTLEAVLPVARALGKLHKAGLIHRDVKTKNIFLRASGELVLGDLGIVFDEASERVTTYESPMSKDWTPPWEAEELNTPARDVFALARIVYAMLTGDKLVYPHWLPQRKYQLAGIFPEAEAVMAVVDEFLLRHIVQHKGDCVSPDGNALAADIVQVLERLDIPGEEEAVFRWGAGHTDPTNAPNRSLMDTPLLIPSWARRVTARGRYFHSAVGHIQMQVELSATENAPALKSALVNLEPGRWSNEVSILLGAHDTGWRDLSVTGNLSGLLADLVLVAKSR